MHTERNIFIAFILNFAFSILEFIGGFITGSVAIASDAVHDMGDALSIGVSCFLEKQSRKGANERYTYGFGACSVMGSIITTVILIAGSLVVIVNAVFKLFNPESINYDGMIIFAIIGVVINSVAVFFTRDGESLNQKAVNLHMLEDVFGWVVVLTGALVMRFTDLAFIDPVMSVFLAVFILINAVKTFKASADIFLERVPDGIDVFQIKKELEETEGISEIHHIHIRSIDGSTNYATMHIVAEGDFHEIKKTVREKLKSHGITHATLETENVGEECTERRCPALDSNCEHHCHHHHHHHHR